MDKLIGAILLVVLLSIIVVVHEFGHFITAKMFNVYCEEFSIGMGPKLFSRKFKETTFSIRAFPIGGFVAMAGDQDNSLETSISVEVPLERTLLGIKNYQKIIIMLAGVFMNFVLAIIVTATVLLVDGKYAVAPSTVLSSVKENSPSHNLLMADDKITGGCYIKSDVCQEFKDFNELSYFLEANENGGAVRFYVERNSENIEVEVTPVYDEDSSRYLFGISSGEYNYVNVDIFNCFGYACSYLLTVTKTLFITLINLFKGVGFQNISGPLGIYSATTSAVTLGAKYYFNLLAIISLNIGVMNLLPLPVLDGGRVLITFIEMIIGKELNKKFVNVIMSISIIILLLLMVFATFQDVVRLF